MAFTVQPHTPRATCQEILAGRLLQLANDTDRVGLHREAAALTLFATSVLDGRKIDITDA